MSPLSFALERFGNIKQMFRNVLVSGVSAFTNCFASLSLMCKGVNKILSLWTRGVFLTLCDPGESFHVLANLFSNNVVHQPCCATTIKTKNASYILPVNPIEQHHFEVSTYFPIVILVFYQYQYSFYTFIIFFYLKRMCHWYWWICISVVKKNCCWALFRTVNNKRQSEAKWLTQCLETGHVCQHNNKVKDVQIQRKNVQRSHVSFSIWKPCK